ADPFLRDTPRQKSYYVSRRRFVQRKTPETATVTTRYVSYHHFLKETAMWVRQCDLDADSDLPSPIPSRIASNEEFVPPPQTNQQKQFEARLKAIADKEAKRQGLDRRAFLKTGSGMAAALVAMNQV